MKNDRLKELLKHLREELSSTEVDDETRAMIEQLDSEVHDILSEKPNDSDPVSVMESARQLETRFAVEHPVAEKFLREIVETLGRMGV